MTTLPEILEADGWSRVTDPSDFIVLGSYVSGATWRNGPTRIALTGSVLVECESKYGTEVAFYGPGAERSLTIGAILVDRKERRKGLGGSALAEIEAAAHAIGIQKLYLEATPMTIRNVGARRGDPDRKALIAWYGRRGFALEPGATRVMTKVIA